MIRIYEVEDADYSIKDNTEEYCRGKLYYQGDSISADLLMAMTDNYRNFNKAYKMNYKSDEESVFTYTQWIFEPKKKSTFIAGCIGLYNWMVKQKKIESNINDLFIVLRDRDK